MDDAIQNFHNPDEQYRKLSELFHLYCSFAPASSTLTVQSCWKAFNQALYTTLRTLFTGSGNVLTAETQFAWRCFTNDLNTPDIIGAYEAKRPSNDFSLSPPFDLNCRRETSGASRNSARAGGAPGAATATTAAAGKRGAAGKDKATDEKPSGKQPQLANATSVTEAQGKEKRNVSSRTENFAAQTNRRPNG